MSNKAAIVPSEGLKEAPGSDCAGFDLYFVVSHQFRVRRAQLQLPQGAGMLP
jgi:hypothetical protein